MKVVTVSADGQISIPIEFRSQAKQYAFEMNGNTIVLKPIQVQTIEQGEDFPELADLSIHSFKFWEDPSNDIYATLL